jgi:hypothetical protein
LRNTESTTFGLRSYKNEDTTTPKRTVSPIRELLFARAPLDCSVEASTLPTGSFTVNDPSGAAVETLPPFSPSNVASVAVVEPSPLSYDSLDSVETALPSVAAVELSALSDDSLDTVVAAVEPSTLSIVVSTAASVALTEDATVETAPSIDVGTTSVSGVFSPTAKHVPLSQKQSEKLGGVPSKRDKQKQSVWQLKTVYDLGTSLTTISTTTRILRTQASISIPSNVKTTVAAQITFSTVGLGTHVMRT